MDLVDFNWVYEDLSRLCKVRVVEKTARSCDHFCGLPFVTRNHPGLDPCSFKGLKTLHSISLQQIFDTSRCNQIEVPFDTTAFKPFVTHVKTAFCKSQCSQPQVREVINAICDVLVLVFASGKDWTVSSFGVSCYFASFYILHNSSHHFALSIELKKLQFAVLLFLPENFNSNRLRVLSNKRAYFLCL